MRMLFGAHLGSIQPSAAPSLSSTTSSSPASAVVGARGPQPRARRASRAPLSKSMSVDETVLSTTGATSSAAAGSFSRPSSMLARVSSSSAVLNNSTATGLTGKGKGTTAAAAAPGKENATGKDGKAATGGPRRVLGDLSNATKVGAFLLVVPPSSPVLNLPNLFCSSSTSVQAARTRIPRLAASTSAQTLLRPPPFPPSHSHQSPSLPSPTLPPPPLRLPTHAPPRMPRVTLSFLKSPRTRLSTLLPRLPLARTAEAELPRTTLHPLHPTPRESGQAIGMLSRMVSSRRSFSTLSSRGTRSSRLRRRMASASTCRATRLLPSRLRPSR